MALHLELLLGGVDPKSSNLEVNPEYTITYPQRFVTFESMIFLFLFGGMCDHLRGG